MNQVFLAFLTGLISGGFSCIAVQGSLLTSSLSQEDISKKKNIILFLLAKLTAYTLLGAVLGLAGTVFVFTPRLQGWIQIAIGLYLLATAGRLLNLHPIFRYTVIQPPAFVLKFLSRISKNTSVFTPLFLGALTILIPCGVTQAMMFLAIGTGSAPYGALLMFAFILGTSPVFFTLGIATSQILKNKALAILTAIIIAILGIFSLNTGQILRGSVHTLQNYWQVIINNTSKKDLAIIKNGFQEVTIEVTSRGYRSSVNTLKLGVPVRLTVISKNAQSCARAFVIPSANYFKVLPANGTEIVEFTPKKVGILTYTCSMGMYVGQFQVVP